MNIWLIIVLSILGLFVIMIAYSYFKMRNVRNVNSSPLIINLNDQNFNQHTKAGIVVVDFWASWCMPCKMMVPVLNDLAEENKGKIKVCKLDVDKVKKSASKYGIRSIPTLIVFKNGKEVKRLTGVKTKANIMSEISKL